MTHQTHLQTDPDSPLLPDSPSLLSGDEEVAVIPPTPNRSKKRSSRNLLDSFYSVSEERDEYPEQSDPGRSPIWYQQSRGRGYIIAMVAVAREHPQVLRPRVSMALRALLLDLAPGLAVV